MTTKSDRLKSLHKRHDQNLKEIEKSKKILEAAQDRLGQANIALGRTLALIDLVEMED